MSSQLLDPSPRETADPTTRRVTEGRARATALCVLALGLVLSLASALPGHLSTDSVIQLSEGRRLAFDSFNPPVMSFLLGVLDRVLPGTALYVTANVVLLYASLAGLLFLRRRTSWAVVPVLVAVVLSPQVVVLQGVVWKDVLFANAALAATVALALSVRHHAAAPTRPRWLWLGASAGLLALAALARQNGLVVALVVSAALVAVTRPLGWRVAVSYGAGLLASVLLVVQGTNTALAAVDRSETGSKIGIGLRVLQTYDVVGAVARDPDIDLSALGASPAVEAMLRDQAADVYSPVRIDTLNDAPEMMNGLGALPREAISAQWRSLLTSNTSTYLAQRADAFRWVFLTPEITRCLPVHVGVDGPPAVLESLGVEAVQDQQDRALYAYSVRFFDTPAYRHTTFALVSVLLVGLLLVRRQRTDLVMLGLQLSALGVAASYFVVSIACDYRYLYFVDLAALAGLVHLASDPPSLRRRSAPAATSG